MEQILNKLSEIEATANAIMQDAARQKQALSEEAEKQTKEFDASLEKETSDEIRKIREDLAREKDARINELRAETEDQLSRLDAYYEAHHIKTGDSLPDHQLAYSGKINTCILQSTFR